MSLSHAARTFLVLTTSLHFLSAPSADVITTVAGGGDHDLPALGATIGRYTGAGGDVAALPSGDVLVIGDHRIYRITPNGRQFIVAGNGVAGYGGDGIPARETMLNYPAGLAADAASNIYVADRLNHRIRRVDAATGTISTIAGNGFPGLSGDGGPASLATLGSPRGIAVDEQGNIFIAADNLVRLVEADSGIITTFAGTGSFGYSGDGGPAEAATFNGTGELEVDSSGNLLIVDIGNRVVRRVDAATGIITTVAGNGTLQTGGGDGLPATSVGLDNISDIGLDADGGLLVGERHRVRKVDPVTGIITTIAGGGGTSSSGDGGPAVDAGFNSIQGVAADGDGNVFVADGRWADAFTLRRVDHATLLIDTVAGLRMFPYDPDGLPAGHLLLEDPVAMVVEASGDLLYAQRVFVPGNPAYDFIRRVSVADGRIETIAGGGSDFGEDVPALDAVVGPVRDLEVDSQGNIYIVEGGRYVEPGPDTIGGLRGPNRIRRVDAATALIRTVAGTGVPGYGPDGVPATASPLALPVDMTFDDAGNFYIAEGADYTLGINGGNRVRKVNTSDGLIETIAGNPFAIPPAADGVLATETYLAGPQSVAWDPQTGDLFIATTIRVRRVSAATGIITTSAGGFFDFDTRGDEGVASEFPLAPVSLALDPAGTLYIGEGFFDSQLQGHRGRVWAMDVDADWIAAYAGSGLPGLGGDGGPALQARLSTATHLALDAESRLLLVDGQNRRIRQVGLGGLANRPPTADAGEDVVQGCATDPPSVILDGGASSDPDDDLSVFEWYRDFGHAEETLLGTGEVLDALPAGSYDVTLRVEDSRGLSDLDTAHVEISAEDLLPPRLEVALEPEVLWPPTHQLVQVDALIDADDDCGPPVVVLESIVSSEPDDAPGPGDGITPGDIADAALGTDDRMFRLRAERDGGGAGRTYTVTYRAEDASGKVATSVTEVFVPHDIGGLVDPMRLSLEETEAGTRVSWDPVPSASAYDVVRGDLASVKIIPHEIRLGSLLCVEASSADLSTQGHEDAARPKRGGIFFYLVQYHDGTVSGFGTADAPMPRAGTGGCTTP